MKVFKLPDLGEGLPDAVICKWYVQEGNEVVVDQPLVAMETAKALVDVPSPFSGKIEKLFGQAGDIIETGRPLIGFEGEAEEITSKDAGTVVGTIEVSETVLEETATTGIVIQKFEGRKVTKATPAVRMLAKQLEVDLSTIKSQGKIITADEVKQAAQLRKVSLKGPQIEGALTPLPNVRHAMVLSMSQSHQDIVPVSLVDDADIQAWEEGQQDITIRLIRAIEQACKKIPIMNAYFDGKKMGYQLKEKVNIGIAVDAPNCLYVPVLKDISNKNDNELRQQINRFKEMAQTRSFPSEDLRGATIMLSNFGTFAGRYANPILLPPMVTIIGVGRIRRQVVPENGQPAIHRVLPLSVTSDHRLITGGEIAQFLKTLIDSLEKA